MEALFIVVQAKEGKFNIKFLKIIFMGPKWAGVATMKNMQKKNSSKY